MSEKPKFDRDIELAKVNLIAEEWRGSLLLNLGTLLTALVAISAALAAAELGHQITLIGSIAGIAAAGVFLAGTGYFNNIRPYRKRIHRLDTLLSIVYDGQPIGELSDLLKEKY